MKKKRTKNNAYRECDKKNSRRGSMENQIGTVWTAESFLYKPNFLVDFLS